MDLFRDLSKFTEADDEYQEQCLEHLQEKLTDLMDIVGVDYSDIKIENYYKNKTYKSVEMKFSELELEEILPYARNSSYDEELTKWIAQYYDQDMEGWGSEFEQSDVFYQKLIDEAIICNNLKGLKILFSSICYFDRACPNYDHALYVAAKHADIPMFLYILYTHLCWNRIDDREEIDKEHLLELAELNHHVRTKKFVTKSLSGLEDCWLFCTF